MNRILISMLGHGLLGFSGFWGWRTLGFSLVFADRSDPAGKAGGRVAAAGAGEL